MLDQDIINQIRSIFATLGSDIAFRLYSDADTPAVAEMKSFLQDVASSSPHLSVENAEGNVAAPTFEIIHAGEPTGIKFCGIPSGHEFSTLLLAVLNADGQGKNLPDAALTARIKALRGPISLRTFVSLTCTNCPDVAQALNIVALLNPAVENTVTDGAVVAGDAVLSVGRTSLGELLEKLEALYGRDEAFSAEPVVREYDVVVLGGGPAGSTAAIYSARKGFNTALVAKAIGGQVLETMAIENLTSVPKTTGPQLAADFKKHLESYPIDVFENRIVESADITGPEKTVVCANETFKAKAVIIATGAGWRRLSVPGESEHVGHGVAFCTHCDGPFYAGQRVAVVGGGNSGIEAAIDLAGMCPHVDVFEFTDSLKADVVLQKKVKSLDNVDIHLSTQVLEILGNGTGVSGIKVRDLATGEDSVYEVSGVFIQIGLHPNSAPFKESLPLTKGGEIVVDERCRTSVKGVYAAGDVTNVPYKQVVVAMGEGAKAALSQSEDYMRGNL